MKNVVGASDPAFGRQVTDALTAAVTRIGNHTWPIRMTKTVQAFLEKRPPRFRGR